MRKHHAGQANIGAKACAAIHLGRNIDPRNRFSSQRAGRLRAQTYVAGRIIGIDQLHRIGKEHAVGFIDHCAISGIERVCADFPFLGCRADQQGPCGGAGLAQALVIAAHRGAAAGELQIQPLDDGCAHIGCHIADHGRQGGGAFVDQADMRIGRVQRCWLHADHCPICAQLVCHNLRQPGINALAHFGLRYGDRYPAINPDLDPAIEQGFAFSGAPAVGIFAGP